MGWTKSITKTIIWLLLDSGQPADMGQALGRVEAGLAAGGQEVLAQVRLDQSGEQREEHHVGRLEVPGLVLGGEEVGREAAVCHQV